MTSAAARVMFNGESEQSGRVCAVVGPGPLSVLGEVWNGRVSLFIGFQSLCSGSIHTYLTYLLGMTPHAMHKEPALPPLHRTECA